MSGHPDAGMLSLEVCPLGAVLVDDGEVVAVNDRFAQTVRSSSAALVGTTFEDLLSPEDVADLADRPLGADGDEEGGWGQWWPVAGLDPVGAPWTGELLDVEGPPSRRRIVLLEPAPAPIGLEGRPEPLRPWGDPEVRLGMDRLLSHDLRGGLRGGGSFLTLLERELGAAGSATVAEYLATSRASIARTDTMVERLVSLMRAGRRPHVLEPVLVHDVLGRAAAQACERSGHQVEVVSGNPCPPVWADPGVLVELLAELLTNAAKFSAPPTGPPPPVTVGLHEVRTGWAYLMVVDEGPGIEPEFCQDAFRPFRLLQPKGRYPGVGMGLAMCRVLAQVQGGRCWIQPDPTPGARVIVRLALASA